MNRLRWFVAGALMTALGCTSGGARNGAGAATGSGGGFGSGGIGAGSGGARSGSGGGEQAGGARTGSGGIGGGSVATGRGGVASGVDAGRADAGSGGIGAGSGGSHAGADAGACVLDRNNPKSCPVCADDAGCNAPKYTDNGDGTVSSSCCGLVWQQGESDKGPSEDYCSHLSLAGGGWRTPTLAELYSLVVLGQQPPAPTIDRAAFPNTPVASFWSTYDSGDAGILRIDVNFGDGSVGTIPNSATDYRYRCVR